MFNVRKNSRDTANPPLSEREEEKTNIPQCVAFVIAYTTHCGTNKDYKDYHDYHCGTLVYL